MESLYKFIGCNRSPSKQRRTIAAGLLAGSPQFWNTTILDAFSLCQTFKPLVEHARFLEASVPNVSESDWLSTLRLAVQCGLLVSLKELENLLSKSLRPVGKPKIQTIAIPTRDRPRMLQRLLADLATHLAKYDRVVNLLVIDDSRSISSQSSNKSVIENRDRTRFQKARYINRSSRMLLAKDVALRLGLPIGLADFCFLGSMEGSVTIGASRNLAVLASGGEAILFMDDDVRCVLISPASTGSNISLGVRHDTQIFSSAQIRSLSGQAPSRCLLNLHEEMLGATGTDIITGHGTRTMDIFNDVPSSTYLQLNHHNAHVVASGMGIFGDPALDHPLPYLVQHKAAATALLRDPAYRNLLLGRDVMSSPTKSVIAAQMGCMTFCLALDLSYCTPPFLPAGRAEEFVWSTLITKCYPGLLLGAIPQAILHEPELRRLFDIERAFELAGTFSIGESISLILLRERLIGADSTALLASAAQRLNEISTLPPLDFQEYMALTFRGTLMLWLEKLESLTPSSSEHYPDVRAGTDIKRFCRSIEAALLSHDHSIPNDVATESTEVDARARFPSTLRAFSQLLGHWPLLASAQVGQVRESIANRAENLT